MRIEHSACDGCIAVTPVGELDLAAAPKVRRALLKHLADQPDAASTQPRQAAGLHLICGRWIASCPGCGFELAEGRRQDLLEHKAARRSCPICQAQTSK
jgi:hypothetical protein